MECRNLRWIASLAGLLDVTLRSANEARARRTNMHNEVSGATCCFGLPYHSAGVLRQRRWRAGALAFWRSWRWWLYPCHIQIS